MEAEDWRRYRHPEPPSDDFDFEITIVKKRLKNHLGDDCFVETEDVFYYSTGCSEFSSESSDDGCMISENIKKSSKEIKKEKFSAVLPEKERLVDSSDEDDSRNRKKKKQSKRKSPKQWSGIEYSDSDDSYEEEIHRNKVKPEKENIKVENKSIKVENKPIKLENKPVKQENYFDEAGAFGEFKCNVCNLTLNSEVTYQTHIRGKKHLKALKAEYIPNIAKMSIEPKANEDIYSQSRLPDHSSRKKFVQVSRVSYIQELVDNYRNGPLPGLSHVEELRTIDKKETSYYCRLCSAPCSSQSIMPHLTGYKHQLRCLEMIDKKRYDYYSYQSKKAVEKKILGILMDYEREHERELIIVKEEVEAPLPSRDNAAYDSYNQPGPSWRNEPYLPGSDVPMNEDMDLAANYINATCKEDLDMSRNDFYCRTCHSHMNNINMWESHVRGKRHQKNKKKCPDESASKVRAIPCPGETAYLMELIKDYSDPIVGLEFLSETQNEVGYMYNCYLCGACATDNDIIDHLLTTKHRTKYLEKLQATGKPNGIVSINALYISNKDSLIEEECERVLERYPPERGVQVLKTKGVFPHGSRY